MKKRLRLRRPSVFNGDAVVQTGVFIFEQSVCVGGKHVYQVVLMNVRKGMQMKRSLFCFGMMVAACWSSAAERVWQATGDGIWSDPANWADGVLPGASDTAVFNSALASDVTVTMDAPEQAITKPLLQNATAP